MEHASRNDPLATLELVVAHFNEDLTWLSPYAPHVTVYTKSPCPESFSSLPSPALSASDASNSSSTSRRTSTDSLKFALSSADFGSVHRLPNIGRETHAYLTHIVRNWDNLASNTIFLQGDIHSDNDGTPAHTDVALEEIIQHCSRLARDQIYPIGRIRSFHDWPRIPFETDGTGYLERRGKTLKRTKVSPAQFWKDIVFQSADSEDMLPHPTAIRFIQGACFGVSRDAIRRRPKTVYERVLKYFDHLNEINPEEGHFMERFWPALLCPEMTTQLSVEQCPDGTVWRGEPWSSDCNSGSASGL